MDVKCNSTLEDLRILPATEKIIVGQFTFHELAIFIAAGSTLIAILLSLFLIMMHATHYTVPHEQKHIIRILLMVPIYATSSFLQLRFYWHAIYFQVISDCYEAFAISSFFSLMCHYIAPDLHEQKDYFRDMHPIKPWVWPLNWFRACCCGERGPWRTPRSGLTWFNIIWIGVYHYCFIRIAGTVTAVVTQYFERYCESSNSPFFAHIWVVGIEAVAVTIAMYCLIQFYAQLRSTDQLAPHQPFLKILAIKLVIFLSFWQSMAISVGTSTLRIIHPNEVLAYPDIKVGIPSLLLCFEMACFALLHLWAFPWRGYDHQANGPKRGGFLGMRALWDAVNVWDVAKGFGRGMRWLFVGARRRREDASYHGSRDPEERSARGKRRGFGDAVDTQYNKNLGMSHHAGSGSTQHLPIASQFRSSVWYDRRHQFRQQIGLNPYPARGEQDDSSMMRSPSRDESAGLIQNAQTLGLHTPSPYTPRSPLSPAPRSPLSVSVSPGPSTTKGIDPFRDTHDGSHRHEPSVSSIGTDSLTKPSNQWSGSRGSDSMQGRHDERRPSYVSMDEELYAATVASVPPGRQQNVYGAGTGTSQVRGGRNLT